MNTLTLPKFVLASLMLAVVTQSTQAQKPDNRTLVLGKAVERELKGDETHSYNLLLKAGQYVSLVVEQKGIDVIVSLFDASGKKVSEVDSPNGTQGPEALMAILVTTGNYRLEVRSPEKTAAAGRYEVKIGELRTAIEEDKNKITAQKTFAEGEALRSQRNAESSRRAIRKYEEALTFYRAARDKVGETVTLTVIGFVYNGLSERQRALEYFSQALLLRRAVGDKRGEAQTLNNIGTVYDALGENQKALENFTQALQLYRAVGDKGSEATTLNNIGSVLDDFGEKQKALESYSQSLLLSRAVGNREGEARTLNNIGAVYMSLGETQKALEYLLQALPLRRAVGDRRGEAQALNNIGAVYLTLGEQQKALEYFLLVLPLRRAVGDRGGEAATLSNIGKVQEALGENQKAFEYYSQSLSLYRDVGDRSGEAITLNNIGGVHNALGERQKAFEYYSQGLPLHRAVGDRRGEANTLDNLSVLWSNSNNHRFATVYGKLSVNNYQLLRGNITKLDKNVRQTFLKSVEKTYRRLAASLLAQERFAEAQQVLNGFKDQQFFDFSQGKQFTPLAVTVREAAMTANLNEKIENLIGAIRASDAFKRKIGTRPATEGETTQLKYLAIRQNNANNDYLRFLKSAEKAFAGPPTDQDRFPDVPDLREMNSLLTDASGRTNEKAVAVYTLIGEEEFRALVITPDDIFSVSTPIKRADFNQKTLHLWNLLRTPKYDAQGMANELYKIIFAPVAAKLPKNTKTILWSLEGSLRYIPMAALHDGKKYLAERYENIIFTRVDNERMTRPLNPASTGTGMGSSEAHSLDLGGEKFNAVALPSVKNELERIFKKGNADGGLDGGVLLDRQFTKAAMLSALKQRNPLVHIASHFRFLPGDEARSFLLLGDGTPFTLDEMKKQTDLFSGVDLLTLSACSTAAQRPDANGREVDGFAELAQRLGAGAVMASLWEVSDDSTAELMTRFYQNYRGSNPTNKAEALRRAQLALLKGHYNKVSTTTDRQLTQSDTDSIKIDPAKLKLYRRSKNAPFAHPYYWSPFILIGNWK